MGPIYVIIYIVLSEIGPVSRTKIFKSSAQSYNLDLGMDYLLSLKNVLKTQLQYGGNKNTVPAPSKSKPGGPSGPWPPAGRVPADPSPQTALPDLLPPSLAGPGCQGLRPPVSGSPAGPSWLALAGWRMGIILGLILTSICASALGVKILYLHRIKILVFFTHVAGRITEENKSKYWSPLRRKHKLKSASDSTLLTG